MLFRKISYMTAAGILACLVFTGCGSDSASQEDSPSVQQAQNQEEEQEQKLSSDTEDEEASNPADPGYKKGDLITEQTFEVNLNPLGEVTFASYAPDTSENPLADAVFQIEKDGGVLSQLPGTAEDNIGSEMFDHVEAVSFYDYNNDSYDDIILIISYYPGADPEAATPHSTIRYYSGTKEGSFVYEKQMSENAATALSEITVQTAKDFISGKRVDEAEGSLEAWQQAYLDYLSEDTSPDGQEGYILITMTDGEPHQLAEIGASEAAGCRIIHFADGKTHVTQLSRLNFTYIPGENLLCNSDGLMDSYYDYVYSIVDGEMTLVASGTYGIEDSSNRQFDADGSIIYQYEWNGVKMDQAEYQKEFSRVYDQSKAVSYDYEKLYSSDEIKKLIKEYAF